MGEVAKKDERVGFYRKAELHARRCVELDPNKAEGHTWLAAALGNRALFEGIRTQIELANEIKAELDRALALRQDDDATYSILGSYYFTLGSVSWVERQLAGLFLSSVPEGGFEESEAAFLKAIAIAPETPRHRFELGKLYLDWGREEEGKRMLESGTSAADHGGGRYGRAESYEGDSG